MEQSTKHQEKMKYNTEKEQIKFREYGRHVQEYVQIALNTPDRQRRTALAHAIVTIMGELHPHLSNDAEFNHKLWDHLHIIANFELEIDSPYPKPTPEQVKRQLGHIPYPKQNTKFRNYGQNLQNLIAKTIPMPEGNKKNMMIRLIVHYLKLTYRNANNNEQATEENLRNDLRRLTNGQIELPSGTETAQMSNRKQNNAPERRPNNKPNKTVQTSNNTQGQGQQNAKKQQHTPNNNPTQQQQRKKQTLVKKQNQTQQSQNNQPMTNNTNSNISTSNNTNTNTNSGSGSSNTPNNAGGSRRKRRKR